MIEREVSYALLPSQGQDLTESITSDDAFVTMVLVGIYTAMQTHLPLYNKYLHLAMSCLQQTFICIIYNHEFMLILIYFYNFNRVGTKLYYCVLEKMFPKSEALQTCMCPKIASSFMQCLTA